MAGDVGKKKIIDETSTCDFGGNFPTLLILPQVLHMLLSLNLP
jgi:hypothetical protein